MHTRPSSIFLPTPNSWARTAFLSAAIAVALSACGSATGGGGGSVGTVGGKLESACNEAYGEGCYSFNGQTSREKCTGGKWTLIENCAQGMVCQEKITVAGQPARTTECKATVVTPGADATSGGDAATGGDATTGGDGMTLPDAVDPGDAKPGDTTGGGDVNALQEALKCAVTACPSQWSSCQQDPTCTAVVSCFGNCTADAITCASSCQKSGDDVSMALLQCAQSACSGGAVCGDGKCTGDEANTCPADCVTGPKCGNGICESTETSSTCAIDCPIADLCGNGVCDAGETPINCLQDCSTAACCTANKYKCGNPPACNGNCGACGTNMVCNASFKCVSSGPVCGNGTCDSGETTTSCAIDCPAATKACGDLTCSTGETSTTCPLDCPPTGCNNGTCSGTETAKTCPQDCDPATQCMLGNCQTEWVTCAKDTSCGSILKCVSTCAAGDTTCAQNCYNAGTTAAKSLLTSYSSCYANAGCSTTTNCGNGTCDTGETNATCPTDCPPPVSDPGCTATATPGCGGCTCEATVCASDPYCCGQDASGAGHWDSACVGECKTAGTTCP